jgi:flagellar hook-length control protein FliK
MHLPGVSEILAANVNDSEEKIEGTEMVTSSSPTIKPLTASESQLFESKLNSALGRTLDDSVMNQVNEKLNTAIRSGINEVRIQLRPESLGDVKCQIRMEGDIVIVKFQVESQQVKQIIESNMQSLKDTLAQQNLQTGSFDVDVGGNAWSRDSDAYDTRNGNSGAQKRFSDNSEFSDNTGGDNESSGVTLGTETGKRYGNNSVEYFG